MYNSLSLSLPQVFVKEHFVYQTAVSRAEAIVGYNADFLVSKSWIDMFRPRADRGIEQLFSTSSALT
jgi:hypothetical protein